jgi:predicted O-linked N-acetylglucosamine transferase (SPINDLY family)
MTDRLNQGKEAHRAGRLKEAEQIYGILLAEEPQNAECLRLLGTLKAQLQDYPEAKKFLTAAIGIAPGDPGAHFNLALVHLRGGQNAEALALSERALTLAPNYPAARNLRAQILAGMNRPAEALAEYERLLLQLPQDAGAHYGRGVALMALMRPPEALDSFNRALAIHHDAPALIGQAVALQTMGRVPEAIAAFQEAARLQPDYALLHQNLGDALLVNGNCKAAIESYDRAYALEPSLPRLAGNRHYAKLKISDWQDFEKDHADMLEGIRHGTLAAATLITFEDDPALQQACARLHAARSKTGDRKLWNGERYAHKRIRLAYVSKDFRDHPNITLATELFERHDREAFEVYAISMGADDQSVARKRLEAAFEHFIQLPIMDAAGVAALIRQLEIDIVVDLDVYSVNSKPEIYAWRPAPVAVNFLGYPGTFGSRDMDYIIADRIIVPKEDRQYYDERVVYMPNSYQANTRRPVAAEPASRAEAGLPEKAFVFCCFNSAQKIVPAVFDIWARLLNTVEGSVLWLYGSDLLLQQNLRSEAQKRGVAPERLIFAARLPHDRHLARHRLADLFLDTLPFNAHTTASDALWAGLPVLTCLGKGFAGRVAASLLTAMGLPELITHSPEEYQALAVALARDPVRLQGLREKLARTRETAPLFDGAAYTHDLESAYRTMWQRYQNGLPPESFSV